MNNLRSRYGSLEDLVDPIHTALLLVECQNGVIGEKSSFPALAEASKAIIPNLGLLAKAARESKVRVIHGLAMTRIDGWGANSNARLFGAARNSDIQQLPETEAVRPIKEIGSTECINFFLYMKVDICFNFLILIDELTDYFGFLVVRKCRV